jgi:hypothetical protein
MKKSLIPLMATCLFVLGAVQSAAQTPPPMSPPPVLQIYREEVKPGKTAAHEAVEAAIVRVFAREQYPTNWLGMTAISGPNEAWFTVPYDSFAALEKDRQSIIKKQAFLGQLAQLDARDGELRSGQRALLAVYRKDLSYRPEQLVSNLPQSRYFNILTLRVRPGRDADFVQAVKSYLEALEKAKASQGSAAYQVVSGAPGGTYLLFLAMKSLEELDEGPARERAIGQALGSDKAEKLFKTISEVVLTTESAIFAFSPSMSYMPKDFTEGDPAFWTPKPKAAARAASAIKKQVAKTQ